MLRYLGEVEIAKSIAAQQRADAKADFLEKAAIAWWGAGKEEVCVQWFADTYDEIQKFRDQRSA